VYPTRDPGTGRIETWDEARFPPPWQHLHALLGQLGHIVPLHPSDASYLAIQTTDVLARIQRDDSSWEGMVPAKVAEIINAKRLFR
jgi:hypothetical protein